MGMRKAQFSEGEHYHVYNRGVDKRSIFNDREDVERFLQCMQEFNVIEPIGSIYENSFRRESLGGSTSKLVMSSWEEYVDQKISGICEKEIILGQFRNTTEYKDFALNSLGSIIKRKEDMKWIEDLLLE